MLGLMDMVSYPFLSLYLIPDLVEVGLVKADILGMARIFSCAWCCSIGA